MLAAVSAVMVAAVAVVVMADTTRKVTEAVSKALERTSAQAIASLAVNQAIGHMIAEPILLCMLQPCLLPPCQNQSCRET